MWLAQRNFRYTETYAGFKPYLKTSVVGAIGPQSLILVSRHSVTDKCGWCNRPSIINPGQSTLCDRQVWLVQSALNH